MSGKRNDSFRRINSTAGHEGSRGELGIWGVPGLLGPAPRGRNAGSCLPLRPLPGIREPRFGRRRSPERSPEAAAASTPASAPRRRHAPHLAASASSPPAQMPRRRRRLPQREGGEGATVPLGSGRRREDVSWPFRSLQALGWSATRAEQTGSTSRGGRPLCYVIKPRPSSCGPAGFPRLPCFSPASFRFRLGRLRALSLLRGARPSPPLCLRLTNWRRLGGGLKAPGGHVTRGAARFRLAVLRSGWGAPPFTEMGSFALAAFNFNNFRQTKELSVY